MDTVRGEKSETRMSVPVRETAPVLMDEGGLTQPW